MYVGDEDPLVFPCKLLSSFSFFIEDGPVVWPRRNLAVICVFTFSNLGYNGITLFVRTNTSVVFELSTASCYAKCHKIIALNVYRGTFRCVVVWGTEIVLRIVF